jgi:hypothetical protein
VASYEKPPSSLASVYQLVPLGRSYSTLCFGVLGKDIVQAQLMQIVLEGVRRTANSLSSSTG